jgi:DNA primase
MLTQPIKFSLFILGMTCALISLVCSALLWTSFSNNLFDSILLAITSCAFVAASYVFVPVTIRLFEFKKWGMFITIIVLEAALTISSVMATIGFLESRFQNQTTSDITSSQEYKHNQTRIDSLTTRINELTTLAKIDRENNYRQRASRLLNKADRLDQQRQVLINKKPTSDKQNTGTALATDLGGNRYALWAVLAVLVDGCPMACFALISLKAPHSKTQNKPNPTQNAARPQDSDDLYQELATEMKSGIWTQKPAIRNVITGKRIRYETAKELFDRLVEEEILIRNGNRYEVAA